MKEPRLCDDRHRGIRESDPEFKGNRRLRASMFNIAVAITQAFFPDPVNMKPGAYGGMRCSLSLRETTDLLIGEEVIAGNCNALFIGIHPAIGFSKEKGIIPSNGMIGLEEARGLSRVIYMGELTKMLEELEVYRGRETARIFAAKLGMRTSR